MIEMVDVHKSFGNQEVHSGLTLNVVKGAITVIIGPSGTGKSVLLKEMMGLIVPDSGQVIIDGKDIVKMSKLDLLKIRRKFGMLFQNAALFDSMDVYDNVAFPLRERKQYTEDEIKDIVEGLLNQVGLHNAENKFSSELSGGMKKRVGLARALALEPEIMLYDEPTTGLDPIMTDVVDDLIYNTQRQWNISSVVISHDISSAMKIADYIGMIYKGKIVYYGTPDECSSTDNPYVRQFFAGSRNGPIQVY